MATIGGAVLRAGAQMISEHFREIRTFVSVGMINTIAGLLVIYWAKWFLLWGDVAANILGYAAGFLLSFTLNSRWTFGYDGPLLQALFRFSCVSLTAYVMNLATVLALLHFLGLNSYVAQTLGVGPYALTTYLASKYYVFAHTTYPVTDKANGRENQPITERQI